MKIQNTTNPTSKKIKNSAILGMVVVAVLVASISIPHMQAFANTFRGDNIPNTYTVNGVQQNIGTAHCTTFAKVTPTTSGDTFSWSVAGTCVDTVSGQTGHIDLVRILVDGVSYDYHNPAQCSDLTTSTSCGTTTTISLSQTSGSTHNITFSTYYLV